MEGSLQVVEMQHLTTDHYVPGEEQNGSRLAVTCVAICRLFCNLYMYVWCKDPAIRTSVTYACANVNAHGVLKLCKLIFQLSEGGLLNVQNMSH